MWECVPNFGATSRCCAKSLTEIESIKMHDPRTGLNSRHSVLAMVRQSIYSRLAGLILDMDSSVSRTHSAQESSRNLQRCRHRCECGLSETHVGCIARQHEGIVVRRSGRLDRPQFGAAKGVVRVMTRGGLRRAAFATNVETSRVVNREDFCARR